MILLACTLLCVVTVGSILFIKQKNEKEKCPYKEFITVDVFDAQANFQGIQSGWFAKVVKDRFNMELNIIAPNVAGGRRHPLRHPLRSGQSGRSGHCER